MTWSLFAYLTHQVEHLAATKKKQREIKVSA